MTKFMERMKRMKTLIAFEFKKFFKRKKNFIAMFVFWMLIFGFIFLNTALEKRKIDSEISNSNDYIKTTKQSLERAKSEYDRMDVSNVAGRNSLKGIIDSYNESISFNEEKIDAIRARDWRKKLTFDIKLDENLLGSLAKGNTVSGFKTEDLQGRIQKNKELLNKDIEPIFEECSMKSYNFLRLISRDVLPLLLMIMVFLFSSDLMSVENDEGTFKFLLLQPISRTKVLFSKIIGSSLMNIMLILGTLFIFFIGLGLTLGFGENNYPVSYYAESFTLGFGKANGNTVYQFIDISKFVLHMLTFLILMVIAYTALSIFISTIIDNSTASIASAILMSIAIYIFNNQLKFFSKIAEFIPFTYNNVPDILSGDSIRNLSNEHVTFLFGIVILAFFTLLCYIAAVFVFRKKDITC